MKEKGEYAGDDINAVLNRYSDMVYRLAFPGQKTAVMRTISCRTYSCAIFGKTGRLKAKSTARPG